MPASTRIGPQLFDAPFIEAGAFHESFGDMSAILSALQLPSVRAAALAGVKGYKASQLSRCAEQLGAAIRQVDKTAVDSDCLRNAYNAFKYVDPQTLPDSAPATAAVRRGAFVLARVHRRLLRDPVGHAEHPLQEPEPSRSRRRGDRLRAAADGRDDGRAGATRLYRAGRLAHHRCRHGALRRQVPRGAHRRCSSSVSSFRRPRWRRSRCTVGAVPAAVAAATASAAGRDTQTQKVTLDAQEFGLGDKKLIVARAGRAEAVPERGRRAWSKSPRRSRHGAAGHASLRARCCSRTTASTPRSGSKKVGITDSTPRDKLRKTHVLTKTKEGLKFPRRLFHCGCTVPCDHG